MKAGTGTVPWEMMSSWVSQDLANRTNLQIIVLVGVKVALMEFPCFDASQERSSRKVLNVESI